MKSDQKSELHIRIWNRIILECWIRIRFRVKIQAPIGSKLSRGRPWTLTMDGWRLKMKPWRVCRLVVADLLHFWWGEGSGSGFWSALRWWKVGYASGSAWKGKNYSGSALKWCVSLTLPETRLLKQNIFNMILWDCPFYDVRCLAWSLQAEKYMEEANYSQATYVWKLV